MNNSKVETVEIPNQHNKKLDLTQANFTVSEYSPICEDYGRIHNIIPLQKSKGKFIIFIILNIFTICIINLFIAWFPKMNLCLIYSTCHIDEATHLGIYSTKDDLIITPLIKVKVPSIDFDLPKFKNSFLKRFNMNFNYATPYQYFLLFKYRLFFYVFNYETKKFEALKYAMKTTQDDFQNTFTTGLEKEEVEHLRDVFGTCDIDIEIHSIFQILLEELTDPFYLFQLYSVILWYCNIYYYYSSVIVVLTILSLILSVYETHKNLVVLHEMSRYSCEVNIYRKDEKGELVPFKSDSTEIVPGDIYEIPEEDQALPCDTILVKGTVIVNEAMLTGESTPIVKNQMPAVESEFDTDDPGSHKFFLFAGTKIVQKRSISNFKVLGIAYSTGFKTIKGNLIRQILFPKETQEQFKQDSGKYILFMGCLCLVGFLISLKFLIEADLSSKEIAMRFLDLITTSVPPSLPACISVGITYSISRLKKDKIICIARERVNVAGKVNIICFDKTGTLTEDHLDIAGYLPTKVVQGKFHFDHFESDSKKYSHMVFDHFKNKILDKSYHDKNKDLKQLFVECLGSCHAITFVNGKLIGDPIDVKMFEGVGWELKENSHPSNGEVENNNKGNNDNYDPLISSYVKPKEEKDLNYKLSNLQENENEDTIMKTHYELGIVRRFDFESKLQRMSTITKNVNEECFKVFCKGSPEKLKELCKPGTIPDNFNEILASYTSKGYRVLAMATKTMKMNFTQSQQVLRDSIETNMIFLGLLIVQNKLKEATPNTIKDLDQADIRMTMATGDNILTAIAVSRECNLVPNNAVIFSCTIEKGEKGDSQLIWSKIDNFDPQESSDTDSKLILLQRESKESKPDDVIKVKNDTSAFSHQYPAEEVTQINMTKSTRDNNSLMDNASEEVELNKNKENKQTLPPNAEESSVSIRVKTNESVEKEDTYFVAITGPNFEQLSKLNDKYKKTKDKKYLTHHITFRRVLKNGVIFARMAPEHKALLVESFKQEHFTVLMCGDGANDCAALRAADVGVSLSPEEASIAAHFTSQIPDISCIVKLLREGKCSLTTSIQTFKYMMLYSLIQFLVITFLTVYSSYLSDFQFLASDLFIIFPLAILIAWIGPYEKLTHNYPIGALISFPVITSISLQTILVFVFQLGGRIVLKKYHEPWYSENLNCLKDESDDENSVKPCEDNSVLFLISNMQYLITAISFSVSKPFRKPVYTNIVLVAYLVIVIFYSIWITINCDDWSLNLFNLVVFYGKNFKYWLLLVIGLGCILSVFFEWVIMHFIIMLWEKFQNRLFRKRIANFDERNQIGEEYSIYDFQRAFFADRRIKKEDSNQPTNIK